MKQLCCLLVLTIQEDVSMSDEAEDISTPMTWTSEQQLVIADFVATHLMLRCPKFKSTALVGVGQLRWSELSAFRAGAARHFGHQQAGYNLDRSYRLTDCQHIDYIQKIRTIYLSQSTSRFTQIYTTS